LGLVIVLGGSWFLKADHLTIAKILLSALAFPAFMFGLYMLLAIFTGSKWN